jgi:hypothetical protein
MSGARDCRAHEACLSVVLVFAALSAGCLVQTYPGPKLPRDQTARIRADHAVVAKAPEPPPAAPVETAAVAAPAEEVLSIPDVATPDGTAPPTQPEVPAGAPAPAAVDSEAPPRRPRAAPLRIRGPEQDETPMWLRHPGSGLTFDVGGFDGGTDLATASYSDGSTTTLSGGTGLFASVGAIWTPIWLGDAVGFGVGGYLGVKYFSVGDSNSSISLTRYPIGGGAHVLLRIGDRWFLFLRGGLQKEFGVSLSSDAYGSASLKGSLGGLGEGGFYYVTTASDDHLAILFSFRYTSGRDSANAESLGADSAGVIFAIHYNL